MGLFHKVLHVIVFTYYLIERPFSILSKANALINCAEIQSFSALKKIACARAQRSDGNFERRSRSRSIFRQSSALARAQ